MSNFCNAMFGNPSLVRATNPKIVDFAQNRPQFKTHNCVFNPQHAFLKSGWLGEHSPAPIFLIFGYGKKSNFRGGTPNLSMTSKTEQDGGH